jgi:hypothetical protein
LPEGLAELRLEDLASTRQRELCGEGDAARALVSGDQRRAVGDELGRCRVVAGLEDDDGVDRFASPLAGDTDHGARRHGRVLSKRVLGLPRVEVSAAADDHVLQAVSDYFPARRVMDRVSIVGDRPYGP